MIDTKQIIKDGEEKMTFAIDYLDEQLSRIRAGKANPKILDCVRVMYYGAPVPLSNVATVTVSRCPYHHDYPVGEEDYP